MNFTDEQRKEQEGKYSPEFLEKLEACGSAQEVEKLIAENGIELSLDDLDQVSGGAYTIYLEDGDEIYVPYDRKQLPWYTAQYGFFDENNAYKGTVLQLRSKQGKRYSVFSSGGYMFCGY